ncbi:MAG: hypothetical protein U1F58_20310 [Burkholderiales bacterium]
MTLEARVAALLELVEADRCGRCDAIVEATRQRIDALLGEAHAAARAQMREAFAVERKRAAERIAAARAGLATRRRLYEQQRAAALLAVGMERLPAALRARWRDDAARTAWVDAVVAVAATALPRDAWRIAHPVDWAEAERAALGARLAAELATAPAFAAERAIAAGMRIAAGGNVIDGTLAGLLADRATIGARLLGLIEDLR